MTIHEVLCRTSVCFLGPTGPEAHNVGSLAGDRYRCQAGEGEEPELLVLAPADLGRIGILRHDHPGAAIVVWDRREPAPPVDVASAIYAGADVYVAGASPKLLVAYLDAFLRRERPADRSRRSKQAAGPVS